MVKREYVLELLDQHQTFLIYSRTKENIFYYFTWDEKKQEYEEYRDLQYENWNELLGVYQEGKTIEMCLKDAEILLEHRDVEIEAEVVSNFIRADYRKRCRELLSGKKEKREKFAALIQDNKEALNLCKAVKMEEEYHLYPKLPDIWEKRKIGKKKGYLMTGFFNLNTYVGNMEQLLEFVKKYAAFDMGILYCPEEQVGIMQFDREVTDGRWYWIE